MNEEKLLPHPFPTNCTDYEALWEKNNRTGPRSKEMCQELCVKMSIATHCESRLTMLMNPKEICNTKGCGGNRFFLSQDWDFLENCMANCRPSCLKRKYQYTVEDIIPDELSGQKRSTIPVNIFLSDRDVTVISHNQLYGMRHYNRLV
ncbi:hypothetical protein HNY73_015415 [Argiope bruennichi]|uniref:Uncharacterized protein n=1 Tax=Argiope bruennichi TaxID=94029 RepID=A0A8T0EXG5_ARGBR|nr:hypothetical protein HNY73_015415 [Argiope bruennichi]